MGVISNKVDITQLETSGGGGDPTIPGRVSELELETAGLIEANAKIMTSVSDCVEAIQYVQTSVQSIDTKVERLEDSIEMLTISVTSDGVKTVTDLLNEVRSKLNNVYTSLSDGETIYLDFLAPGQGNTELQTSIVPIRKATGVSLPTMLFAGITMVSDSFKVFCAQVKASNSVYKEFACDATGITVTNHSTDIPTSGKPYILGYHIA